MHKVETSIILDKESPLSTAKANNGTIELDAENELAVYIIACSKSLSSIRSSMEKARLSVALLDAGYLDSITAEDQSKSAYIEMLVENSIIRVQSIYDRVLIFTNRILDLGISNESINHNLLVTNENAIKFGLDGKLKAINKACGEYRFIRNTVIHHDRYTEEQLSQLTLIIDADHLSKEAGGEQFIDSNILNEITQAYLNTKKEELGKYLDGIENSLFGLYDAILPVYYHYKDKLRAK